MNVNHWDIAYCEVTYNWEKENYWEFKCHLEKSFGKTPMEKVPRPHYMIVQHVSSTDCVWCVYARVHTSLEAALTGRIIDLWAFGVRLISGPADTDL